MLDRSTELSCATLKPRPGWGRRYWGWTAAAFASVFALAALLALHPSWFGRPVTSWLNIIMVRFERAGSVAHWLTYPSIQSVPVVAMVCFCWFRHPRARFRAGLLAGVVAAVLAGIGAELLVALLHSSPKPLFDPTLHLQAPRTMGDIAELRADTSHNMHSFPSPRATLFGGLAISVFCVSASIGTLSLFIAAVPDVARVIIGLHYPSDVVGSYCLAGAFVSLAHMKGTYALEARALRWQMQCPALFYALSYVVLYEITDTFDNLRHLF